MSKLTVFLALVVTMLGCGETPKPPEIQYTPISDWIGAWQHTKNIDGTLTLTERKTLFKEDGTWERSDSPRHGTVVVFETRFILDRLDRSSPLRYTGSWTRHGNTLTLVYDTKNTVEILKKTSDFVQYIPPPPKPPPPPPAKADSVSIFPPIVDGLPPNANITITFNEPVRAATVNGVSARGSGKVWLVDLDEVNLPRGRTILKIGWTNKDQTASDGVGVPLNILNEPDRQAPSIKTRSVRHNQERVNAAHLNHNGITFTFTEDVFKGHIAISPERGDDLDWSAEWGPNSVTIRPKKGAELRCGSTYEIELTAVDIAGNTFFATIIFSTRA